MGLCLPSSVFTCSWWLVQIGGLLSYHWDSLGWGDTFALRHLYSISIQCRLRCSVSAATCWLRTGPGWWTAACFPLHLFSNKSPLMVLFQRPGSAVHSRTGPWGQLLPPVHLLCQKIVQDSIFMLISILWSRQRTSSSAVRTWSWYYTIIRDRMMEMVSWSKQ